MAEKDSAPKACKKRTSLRYGTITFTSEAVSKRRDSKDIYTHTPGYPNLVTYQIADPPHSLQYGFHLSCGHFLALGRGFTGCSAGVRASLSFVFSFAASSFVFVKGKKVQVSKGT